MNGYQFTPAAERALAAAAHWTNNGDSGALDAPHLLLGLLAEAESRAAEMLAARGITEAMVRERWTDLRPRGLDDRADVMAGGELSPELEECFLATSARLAEFDRPLIFATEHLLLGLVAGPHEISSWLAGHGFDAGAVAAEIYRRHGYEMALDGTPAPLVDSTTEPPLSAGTGRPPQVQRPTEDNAQRGLAADTARRTSPTSGDAGVRRVLDAAANRAREALRVVEDFARFVRNDQSLTGRLKLLRHRLTSALGRLPAGALLAARDTPGDVGTSLTCAGEQTRPDLASVVAANCKRLQESLRSLEEYGKVVDIAFAAEIEQIRYESYSVERALAVDEADCRSLLAAARLYVLIDGQTSTAAFEELAAGLIESGVDVLQLRDKRLADRELLERARRLRELTHGTRTLFIMNDRPDLGALATADGVHVGQDELSVAETRTIAGPHALVGVSTHSLAQARRAVADGADYIGIGPTFSSRTKAFDAGQLQGVELLRAVAGEIQIPGFAIGGIEAGNLADVLAAGITRIAVSGAVISAADPRAAARELRGRLL